MPKIRMCDSVTCPARRNCYRHEESGTAPSEHQPYLAMDGDSAPSEDERCTSFWPAGQIEMPFTASLAEAA